MNVVPHSSQPSTVNSTMTGTDDSQQYTEKNTAAQLFQLPDTLRLNQGGSIPLSHSLNDRHPLESHLKNFDIERRNLKLKQYNDIFGVAAPMKNIMDLNIINSTNFNPLNNNTNNNLHSDILLNKDCSIDWEDIYNDNDYSINNNTMNLDSVHTKIEHSLNI